ncbi:hypothetical protein PFISCL1PPCAC_12867, partial [Pristionchus fissidentatus]
FVVAHYYPPGNIIGEFVEHVPLPQNLAVSRNQTPINNKGTIACDGKPLDIPLSQYREQILSDHNKYRAMHGCASLRLTDELNRSAQEYAKELSRGDAEQL